MCKKEKIKHFYKTNVCEFFPLFCPVLSFEGSFFSFFQLGESSHKYVPFSEVRAGKEDGVGFKDFEIF